MWNGWKKAAIGLSALLAFVLLELMAVIGGVAVFLGLVMDVDLPFFAALRGIAVRAAPDPAAMRQRNVSKALGSPTGDSSPFLRRFGSLEARMPAPAIDRDHKNRYDSTTF